MGLMDLSTKASSKKHVDFSDARYQLVDKLKQNANKNVRSTFTLYDNREYNKIAVQEISTSYELSDKRLPIGELLNKMVDLIVDMEDGILDTEKDAVYAWKYSMALLQMYEDKRKRQESLTSFDNGLKSSVINSTTFIEKYPGKYNSRTNFFDAKVKTELVEDICALFKNYALPRIHDSAVRQSKEVAEKHYNPILDRIVQWAVDNYRCKADSFFEVTEDKDTHLFYSTNTIIVHLRNGYDMSIVGYVGTDHDDKFAISIFNARDLSIETHGERMEKDVVEQALTDAMDNAPVDPLSKLLAMEKNKNDVLAKQYEILAAIRPMIPASVLELKAAETVVGYDYIWGCKQWRENHEELPKDFSLESVELPKWEGETEEEEAMALVDSVNDFHQAVEDVKKESEQQIISKGLEYAVQNHDEEAIQREQAQKAAQYTSPLLTSMKKKTEEEQKVPVQTAELEKTEEQIETAEVKHPQPTNAPPAEPTHDVSSLFDMPDELFEPEKPKPEQKKFGDSDRVQFVMPRLDIPAAKPAPKKETAPKDEFNTKSTLLPGAIPIKKKEEPAPAVSVTSEAKPMHNTNTNQTRGAADKKQDEKQPDVVLDDIDALFG